MRTKNSLKDHVAAREYLLSLPNRSVDPVTHCWYGGNYNRKTGYTQGTWEGRTWNLHRLSMLAFAGDVPDGVDASHTCGLGRGREYRACYNPDHIKAVSHRQNTMADKRHQALLSVDLDHCSHGHLLTEDNVSHDKGGSKHCRICGRLASQRYGTYGFGKPHTGTCHRPISVSSPSGALLGLYAGPRAAATFGYAPSGIVACCRGRVKTYKGLVWAYLPAGKVLDCGHVVASTPSETCSSSSQGDSRPC